MIATCRSIFLSHHHQRFDTAAALATVLHLLASIFFTATETYIYLTPRQNQEKRKENFDQLNQLTTLPAHQPGKTNLVWPCPAEPHKSQHVLSISRAVLQLPVPLLPARGRPLRVIWPAGPLRHQENHLGWLCLSRSFFSKLLRIIFFGAVLGFRIPQQPLFSQELPPLQVKHHSSLAMNSRVWSHAPLLNI
ncbi:hypothetical protein BJ166DRAFT_535601 [Pestalotiopsis sp. NC0098]|nr:hypothetical protein BJ166DRAFT_535601 [Pestalotiopsis sp. NC0098]